MAAKAKLGKEDFDAIVDYLTECRHDPLKFVMLSFPWGEPGTELENKQGPEEWQRKVLADIKEGLKTKDVAIREAVASGHGIGKSALVSWLILWGLSTHENTRGVVTANTESQLTKKTWAELVKWYNMWIAKDLFSYTATAITVADGVEQQNAWRIDAIPWSEHNSEAFAGLHNQGNRILIIFDEASAIADVIWEVAEGALTDSNTEIVWCAFGNPTRANGRFYDCFHAQRELWNRQQIDSRTVSFTNKAEIANLVKIHGEDSDIVKVRVRGEFPSASENQFIGRELVDEATKRVLKPRQYQFAAVVIGVDPAWSGGDATMIYLRQGFYCKRLMKIAKNENDLLVARYIADFEDKYHADAVFIDLGYGTGIKSAGEAWGRNWTLVAFGARKGVRLDCRNKRAEMWQRMKEWLEKGGAISADDKELVDDLCAPELAPTDDGIIQLESKEHMKKRGVPSPNSADALALTFAQNVLSKAQLAADGRYASSAKEYDPFEGM